MTRLLLFLVMYLGPIMCLWFFDDTQEFFDFTLDLNFFINFVLILLSLVFSNFISLKIFRKIGKHMDLDE